MWKLSYPVWEDIRVVIGGSIAISAIAFCLINLFTNNFRCSKWIIFIPTLISLILCVCSVTLIFLLEGKSGVLQHIFLGVLTYSICILIVTLIIAIIVSVASRGRFS